MITRITTLSCIRLILSMALLIVFTGSCQDEEVRGKGSIKLRPHAVDENTNGRSQTNRIDDAAKVFVSIESTNGEVVYDNYPLELVQFGGEFVSANLRLTQGSYVLTQFVVADGDNNSLFASPVTGSALADLVQDPLPIEFVVQTDEVTVVSAEVITTEDQLPENFGYASFVIDVVETQQININTFFADLPDAEGTGYSLEVIAKDQALGTEQWRKAWQLNGLSSLTIPKGYGHYSFIVSKDNYLPHAQYFENSAIETMTSLSFELISEAQLQNEFDLVGGAAIGNSGIKVYVPRDFCRLYARIDIPEGVKVSYFSIDRAAFDNGGNNTISDDLFYGGIPFSECHNTHPGSCNYFVNVYDNRPYLAADDFCQYIVLPSPVADHISDLTVDSWLLIEYTRAGESTPENEAILHVFQYGDENPGGRIRTHRSPVVKALPID